MMISQTTPLMSVSDSQSLSKKNIRSFLFEWDDIRIVALGHNRLGIATRLEEHRSYSASSWNIETLEGSSLGQIAGYVKDLFPADNGIFGANLACIGSVALQDLGKVRRGEIVCRINDACTLTWSGLSVTYKEGAKEIKWLDDCFCQVLKPDQYGDGLPPSHYNITSLFFSKTQNLVAFRQEDIDVICIMTRDGTKISQISFPESEGLEAFSMAENGMIAAITTRKYSYQDAVVKLFSATGALLSEFGRGALTRPTSIASLPDGKIAIAEKFKITIWA